MPNKGRGEMQLAVGENTYVLRPSFGTMAKIEDAAGVGAVDLLERGRAVPCRLKMTEVILVLWLAAKNSRNRDVLGMEEFGETLRRSPGLVAATGDALEFLGNSLASDAQLEEIAKLGEEDEGTKDPDPSTPPEKLPGNQPPE